MRLKSILVCKPYQPSLVQVLALAHKSLRDINNRIASCISELQQGLKGSTKLSTVCSAMEATKEKSTGSDSKMSSCRSYVKSEQTRCQGRINTLDAEIKELERQIKAQGGTIYFWE